MTKSLAAAARKAAAAIPELVRDVAGLAGAGLVSYGCWLIYPPAGFIAGGSLLIIGALSTAFGSKGE